jgi:hypothetical protein
MSSSDELKNSQVIFWTNKADKNSDATTVTTLGANDSMVETLSFPDNDSFILWMKSIMYKNYVLVPRTTLNKIRSANNMIRANWANQKEPGILGARIVGFREDEGDEDIDMYPSTQIVLNSGVLIGAWSDEEGNSLGCLTATKIQKPMDVYLLLPQGNEE